MTDNELLRIKRSRVATLSNERKHLELEIEALRKRCQSLVELWLYSRYADFQHGLGIYRAMIRELTWPW